MEGENWMITSVNELEERLARPGTELIEMMKRLDGDIMILGIAGKMGLTMGKLALNAIKEAGVNKKVFGVARFSSPDDRKKLDSWGSKPSRATCSIRMKSQNCRRSATSFSWRAENSERTAARI